jgi:hypothetical protein
MSITLDALALARGLDPNMLRALGWTEGDGVIAIPWPSTGEHTPEHLRTAIEKGEGKRWKWRKYDRSTLLPYGADRLDSMRQTSPEAIVITESEVDAVCLWTAGIAACATGGTEGWQARWWPLLAGFEQVIGWVEDAGSVALVRALAASRPPDAPDLLICHNLGHAKDAGRILASLNGSGKATLRQVIRCAVPVRLVDDLHDAVVDTLGARRSGQSYECRCPFHDDRHPSLSIFHADDGWGFRCHAGGCGVKGTLGLLGVALGLLEESQLSQPLKSRECWESSDHAGSTDTRPWLLTLAQLREKYSGMVEWVVPGYIARRELTLIPGPPESCKSWAMVDLARAVLTGGEWLGHFRVEVSGPVLFIEQERAGNLVYQVGHLEQGTGCDLSTLHVIAPCGFTLDNPDWQHRLRTLVNEIKPVLVVINSFRSVYRGRAADGVEIARAFGWLGQMADESGAAICMIDQTNKAGGTGLSRGMAAHADSLQKEYEADCVLHVERGRDAVGRGTGPASLYVGKRRAGQAGPPIRFEVQEAGDGALVVYVGEAEPPESRAPETAADRIMAALRAAGEPLKAEVISERTSLPITTTRNTLSALKKAGQVITPQYGFWCPAQESQLSQTLEACESWDSSDYGEPSVPVPTTPDTSLCPDCEQAMVDGCCYRCDLRPCRGCGQNTGSVLRSTCTLCALAGDRR